MPSQSPLELDLTQLSKALVERQWTARATAEATMSRIRELDRDLHAFCTLDETAIAQAEDVDRRLAAGLPVGPLAGVPVFF